MKEYKKRIFFITAFILLIGYYSKDYKYKNSHYEIIDDIAYAKCDDGLVYIGNEKFLEKIETNEKDILICDNRNNTDDPDMIVYNSCLIDDKNKRNELLEILCEYEKDYPSNWNRSIESMRLEWFMHNLSYSFQYRTDRTADVDLNNEDEQKYNKKVLRKILRL